MKNIWLLLLAGALGAAGMVGEACAAPNTTTTPLTLLNTPCGAAVPIVGAGAGNPPTCGSPSTLAYFSGGYVNKYRNGTMDIWARGAGAFTVTTAGAYTADGWFIKPVGASVTVSEVAVGSDATGTVNALQITGAASVTDIEIIQPIESYVAAPLAGQQVTAQFWAYQTTGGSVVPTLDGCAASAQDNFTTCNADETGVSLQSATTATWTHEAYSWPASASAYNGYETRFHTGALGASQTFEITAADLRSTPGVTTGQNASPPPPELRPIATEATFNDRYFEEWNGNIAGTMYRVGYAANSVTLVTDLSFLMRSSPTLTFSAAANFQVIAGNIVEAVSSVTPSTASPFSAQINWTVASGLTVGFGGNVKDSGSGNSYIRASAELTPN